MKSTLKPPNPKQMGIPAMPDDLPVPYDPHASSGLTPQVPIEGSRVTIEVQRDVIETPQPCSGKRWLTLWMLLLAGLAMGGKGTAYIGYAPAYISEVVLIIGFCVLLLQRGWRDLLMMPTVVLMIGFIGWGLAQTLPYLSTYKVDALRDGVLYGYAMFGLVVACVLISQPRLLPWVLEKYRGFACVFLLVMPFFWVIGQAFDEKIPEWPMAPGIPIIDFSTGDAAVHLGGIVAFAIVGLFRAPILGLSSRLLNVLWRLEALAVDPAGKQRSSQTGVSEVDVLRQARCAVRTPRAPLRLGIEAVMRRMDQGLLRIHPRCTGLITALQKYRYNPKRPNDENPLKEGSDHACDALRYLVLAFDRGGQKVRRRIY